MKKTNSKKKAPSKQAKNEPDEMIGMKLPTISLASSEGNTVKLPADIKGHWTLLYFYPKDNTPGCTRQACTYRDRLESFKDNNVLVFGVNADSINSHNKFIQKYDLNFPLLSDPDRTLSTALGTYGEKKMYGKAIKGMFRDTFLIDPQGKICKVWRKVKPDTTAAETFSETMEAISK